MNTYELAKKLNAVDLIHVDRICSGQYSKQYFDYLFVLDFEATCWDKTDSNKGASEIIEFPCVLYDLKQCKIVSEFQQYVMPTERPKLSEFCTNLTGIQQYQVDSGVPLGTCLMLFNKWINEQMIKFSIAIGAKPYKRKGIFVTWSDWDLGKCLKNELKRKYISNKPMFCQWIDLRILYIEHYFRKPKGLLGALTELGLTFDGRQHCGLDDARNTAKLAGKMAADGVLLIATKTIQPC